MSGGVRSSPTSLWRLEELLTYCLKLLSLVSMFPLSILYGELPHLPPTSLNVNISAPPFSDKVYQDIHTSHHLFLLPFLPYFGLLCFLIIPAIALVNVVV